MFRFPNTVKKNTEESPQGRSRETKDFSLFSHLVHMFAREHRATSYAMACAVQALRKEIEQFQSEVIWAVLQLDAEIFSGYLDPDHDVPDESQEECAKLKGHFLQLKSDAKKYFALPKINVESGAGAGADADVSEGVAASRVELFMDSVQAYVVKVANDVELRNAIIIHMLLRDRQELDETPHGSSPRP